MTALPAFLKAKAAIDAALATITAASADHFGNDPNSITWGAVGELDHIRKHLEDLAAMVTKTGEYAR